MSEVKWTPQQNEAITTVDTNLIVTAGAGSGKTATMIERAYRLVLRGVPLRRITMLTFTEKAAAEMKEKFRTRLAKALQDETDPKVRAYLIDQIDAIPYASVCTIDSYCYALVRENFEQIPLPPNIRILDSDAGENLAQRAFRRLVDSLAGDADFDDLRSMVGLRNDNALCTLVLDLYRNMVIQPRREAWLDDTYDALYGSDFDHTLASRYLVQFVTHYAREGCNALRRLRTMVVGDDKTIATIDKFLQRYQGLELGDTIADVCRGYQGIARVMGNASWKGTSPLLPQVKKYTNLLEKLKKVLDPLVAMADKQDVAAVHRATAPFVRSLFDLVRGFESRFRAEKMAAGGIDFNDVEHYAMQLLADEAFAADIRARHDYVFVDEFQDVNYLQSALIDRISPPDRLVVVGDSKQCIYRFRLAEPQIFLDRVQAWKDLGNNVNLVDNFRSDNGILRFVNRLFGVLMTKPFGGVDYADTDSFSLRADAVDSGDSVVRMCIVRCPDEGKAKPQGIYSVRDDVPVPDADSMEGKAVADYIRSLVGTTVILDGRPHTLGYGDFAILAASRNAVSGVVRYLQKEKFPLNLDSIATDAGLHQVLQLLQFAYLLDNGLQDYPLLSVMRSAFGGFDDSDLAAIRLWGDGYIPYWQLLRQYAARATGELADRVRAFGAMVQRYRFMASFTPLATLFDTILADTGYWDHLYMQPDGQAVIAALHSFLAKVGAGAYGTELVDFCQYFRAKEPDEIGTAVAMGSDSIIVSTIHESKGLQYPVVIVAGCGTSFRNDTSAVPCDRDLGVGTYYYDTTTHWRCPTLMQRIIALKHLMQNREDKLRLFYVACTRAQCHLFVVGRRKGQEDAKYSHALPAFASSFLSLLEIGLFEDRDLARYLVAPEVLAVAAQNNRANWDPALAADPASAMVDAIPAGYVAYDEDEVLGAPVPTDVVTVEGRPVAADSTAVPPPVQGDAAPHGVEEDPLLQLAPDSDEVLDYVYPYLADVALGKKYTVTALNDRQNEGDSLPATFLQEEQQTALGNVYHTVFQYIDYNLPSLDAVRGYLAELVADGLLTDQQCAQVDAAAVWRCVQLPLLRMAGSTRTMREQRFLLQQQARVIGLPSDENVLVQGVIDLVIVQGDHAIVVDFKHSHRPPDRLQQAYSVQLAMYCRAVTQAMGLTVDRCVLVEINRALVIEMDPAAPAGE